MKVGDYVKIKPSSAGDNYYHTEIMKIIDIDKINTFLISVDYYWDLEASDGSRNVIHKSKLYIDDECRLLKSRTNKLNRILK